MPFQEFVDISDIAIVKCVYLSIAKDYIILYKQWWYLWERYVIYVSYNLWMRVIDQLECYFMV